MSLQYDSWTELQKACELTKDVRQSLNVLSGPSIYKQLVSMTKKAAEHEREGKLDLALVMTRRAAEVCDILKQKTGFTSTTRTPEAREFYQIFSDVIRQAESLRTRVKPFLEVPQKDSTLDTSTSSYSRTSSSSSYSRRDSSSSAYAADTSSSPYSMARGLSRMTTDDSPLAAKPTKQESPSVFVRALDVVNAVEKEQKSALIIDFRAQKDKRIQYQNDKAEIKILSVDPLILMPGCSITSLIASLDPANRLTLWSLDTYDLVVLVGDEQRSRFEDYSPRSVTQSLIGALTTHNSLRLLPKTIHLLADGFRGWEMTYPMYVSSSQPARRRVLDDDSEFSILVAKAREATAVDADYPDLLAPRKPTPYDASAISRRTPSPTTLRRPSSSLATMETAAAPIHRVPSIGDMSRRPLDSRQQPQVDRAGKPPHADGPSTSTWIGKENAYTGRIRCESPSQKVFHKALPVVPTLGGARKDLPSAQAGEPAPRHAPPARPPIPDRSTKAALIESSQTAIRQIYEYSRNDIDKNARKGGVRPGCTGLFNLGNTCFINTTLQALFHTPQLRQLFTEHEFPKHVNPNSKFGSKGVISACFSSLMDAVWSGEYVAIRPSKFLDVFADKVNPDLADRRQHDAQEFLIFLLDALNEDTCRGNHKGFEQHYTGKDLKADAQDYEEKGRSFFSSSIKDLFYVRTVSELRCTVCRTLSVTFEEMSQISVELPSHSSYATLDECLARHFAPVTLDGASRWNCPTCKCAQAATRETRIWKLPPVLVVHMKRFSHGVTGFVKNEMEVDFRVDGMKMASFVHLTSPEGGADYHLYAVTNHDGTLNSGHYTSFVRNMHTPQEWIKFDDEAVSAASASQLVSKKAFILYYKRH